MTISKQLYANNAKTTLVSSLAILDTVITVLNGSLFPAPINEGDFFRVTLEVSGTIEIIKVFGRSGNTFTGCVRGAEGTLPSAFPSGTSIGCRTTRDTLSAFAKLSDRLDEISSVEVLTSPVTSDGNSYICHSNEDSGNPIVALRSTEYTWRFPTHPTIKMQGAVEIFSNRSLSSTNFKDLLAPVIVGKYILQFTSGLLAGTCKMISYSASGLIGWESPLVILPKVGDTFEVYKSLSSTLLELSNIDPSDGLIFSLLLQD
jgi:hypothetical protein